MSSSPVKSTPVNTIIETSLVLCDCIREWQDETASTGDGKLDWQAISQKMTNRSGKPVSKLDLQTVWRYIAYGKHFGSKGKEEESTYSDDEEPFLQPFSAVKRHKIYLSQNREGVSIQERVYLPPSTPDTMNVRAVGRSIKMDIPQHIKHADGGLQPPLYVPSNEIIPRGMMMKPLRNPRVSQLAAQGNAELTAALKKAQEPVVVYATAGASYNAKRPEVVAQAMVRSAPTAAPAVASSITPTVAPAGAAMLNKFASVAGVWTGTGAKATGALPGTAPGATLDPSKIHSTSTPGGCGSNGNGTSSAAPSVQGLLKRPYSPPKPMQAVAQHVAANGYVAQAPVQPHNAGAVASVTPVLLSVPVPIVYPAAIGVVPVNDVPPLQVLSDSTNIGSAAAAAEVPPGSE